MVIGISIPCLCSLVRGDIQDEAAHKERCHKRGAPVRDKRQWQTGERDDAEHRRDISKRLQNNNERKSERDEAAEEVARFSRYHHPARRKGDEERQQNGSAKKAGFFGEDGEYRIAIGLRQIIKFTHALSEPPPEEAAGADG